MREVRISRWSTELVSHPVGLKMKTNGEEGGGGRLQVGHIILVKITHLLNCRRGHWRVFTRGP